MDEINAILMQDIRNATSIEQRALAVQTYAHFLEAWLIQGHQGVDSEHIATKLSAEPIMEREIEDLLAVVKDKG